MATPCVNSWLPNINVGSGRGRARVADDWEERQIVEEDLKGFAVASFGRAVR